MLLTATGLPLANVELFAVIDGVDKSALCKACALVVEELLLRLCNAAFCEYKSRDFYQS
jgi:hypothetical protein